MRSMNVLIWFKRDLRAHDHPALSFAAGLGAVLPLYIVEPDYWALPDTSARQWAFTAESIEDLRHQLTPLGAPLMVRVGCAQAVLERLCRAHNITRIISHIEVGNAFTHARDRRIAAWAQGAGIIWDQLPQSGPARPNTEQWHAKREVFLQADQLPAPMLRALPGLEPGLIPTARALRLTEDRCAHRQQGGRVQGLELLHSFITLRGEPYLSAAASPLLSERACSRLSPHLSLGTLSLREVAQASLARADERPGPRWAGAMAGLQNRLNWRDRTQQSFDDQPSIEHHCLFPPAELLRRSSDASHLQAWQKGETGLPYLDACLRYLGATGWLNTRARGLVINAATQLFGLDWRIAGASLARRFTDYEPGIHWPQVQAQAGTTANATRLCNPVKQGSDLDPTGAFTRRWLPELSSVPDSYLQTPWRWSGASRLLGRRYPEPIVDLATASRAARETSQRLHPKAAQPAARIEIIENTRPMPRPSHGQLSLDL
jgi:deoxyribodipyrimidine photo-lyase